jgi:hypothetical protein
MRLVVFFFLILSTAAYGQRKKKAAQESGAIAVGPYFPDDNKYSAKKSKSKGTSLQRYKVQRKSVNKQKRKAERILEGPNYGSVNFFGHKREPVKNKPGKTRYCKECQIWH